MDPEICYSFLDSPVGRIWIASSNMGIVYIKTGVGEDEFLRILKQKFCCTLIKAKKEHERVEKELTLYFKGKLKVFRSTLDLRLGTPFQLKVWDRMRKIPYGRTASYKSIAIQVGQENSARAVGNAARKNPIPIIIPCHRVIKSNGSLGGYSAGIDIKRKLLEFEGV